MKRFALLAASAIGITAVPSALMASSDSSCEVSWKVSSRAFGCESRAMLSPGNDTRVNMLLLLRERVQPGAAKFSYPEGGWESRALGHSFFYWGTLRETYYPQGDGGADGGDFSGSRCASLSNSADGFTAALAANKGLTAPERAALATARGRLDWACRYGGSEVDPAALAEGTPPQPKWPDGINSPAAREYMAYLQAAEAFYAGMWNGATNGFSGLDGARDAWVREAAAYMLGRVELNAAQDKAFDDFGTYEGLEKIDREAVARGQAAFGAYLGKYPQGRYAASARGLLRRAMWLGGDIKGLARAYEAMMGSVAADKDAAADLVQEIDNKLLFAKGAPTAIDSPLLLATMDLMAMRPENTDKDGGGPVPGLTAAALAGQDKAFAARPDLYGYLKASHAFYFGSDMRQVLTLIPDDSHQKAYTPLAFSRQMLRGMALAALKDRNEAGFWRDLLGGAEPLYQRPLVELALAMNLERSGKLADVFAPASLITDSSVRQILMQQSAGPDLLRAAASDAARPRRERDVALFTLLYKQLSRGRYAAFASDSALVPSGANLEGGLWQFQQQDEVPVGLFTRGKFSDGYACGQIAQTAAVLARNPRDVKARLCLGEFYRLNGFDDFAQLDTAPKSDELGGAPSLFPGTKADRGPIYAAIMNDASAAADDRAYALYRAVYCYAPGGSNSCGGADVDQAQRRAWFNRLKQEFPASAWARKIRYFW